MSSEWRKKIEAIGPGDLLEVSNVADYEKDKHVFIDGGFTEELYHKLFPLMEQQIWSLFTIFTLAKSVPKGGTILEIGSGRGGSICAMGAANPDAKLINIDKFSSFDEETAYGLSKDYPGFKYEDFLKNIEPFNLNLKTIQKWSDEAVNDIEDGSMDMIFVDGNHSYQHCKNDILNYEKKVKKGGIFCGHDYHPRFPGVIKAVKEIYRLGEFDVADNSSIWIRKW